MGFWIKVLIISFLGSNLAFGQSDTLNQTDKKGLKQGYWIIYGADNPEKGYCDTCIIEEGTYLNSRKDGLWKKYHKDGVTIRLQGSYVNGRLYGEYFKKGNWGYLTEEGFYFGPKNKGVYRKYYENGMLSFEKVFNEDGKEDGWTVYYFENKDLADTSQKVEMKLFKNKGITQDTAYRYYYSGCLKERIIYKDDGMVERKDSFKDDCNLEGTLKIGTAGKVDPTFRSDVSIGPKGGGCIPSRKFLRDGYNSLFNKNDDIEMEGYFKKGKLYNGRLYKYDNENRLEKMEIWENGEFLKLGDVEKLEEIKVPEYFKECFPPENEEIYEDGEYKNGKLWNGKKYNYNKDGILLNIEIWRKGKFIEYGNL